MRSYIAEEVYEGVVAAVGHGEHVAAEPDHVDVLVTASEEPMSMSLWWWRAQ